MRYIADAFADAGGRVTFFCNGNRPGYSCIYDSNRVADLKHAMDRGHQIGNHGWSHTDLAGISGNAAQLNTELTRVSDAIGKITGRVPRAFRPPYGNYDDTVVATLSALGYFDYFTLWSVADHAYDPAGAQAEIDRINSLPTDVPYIILSHDYPITDPQGSTVAQVVPVMIDWARRNGLTMATVHECMGYPDPASWYVNVGSPGTRDASWVC